MVDVLPVIADTPSMAPRLGFEAYADALARAVRGGEPAQFTIGIYGAWGSGKSSLLHAIENELKPYDDVLTVPFDAWRYERADHIIVPLLHSIKTLIGDLQDAALSDKVRTALTSVIKSITFRLGPLTIDPSRYAGDAGADSYEEALDAAYQRPYADMAAIGNSLGDRRIVVFIDDLDRCSPDKAVSLLEAINLVMDVPGFIFVLALDYEVLVKAVATRYPYTSGHVFIEKMVQVPFRVPRLDLRREGFLEDLIPNWVRHRRSLPSNFDEIAYDVATMGLEANPRQVKRFINSVLVLTSIAERRIADADVRLLAGLVGLQLRWPAEYQDFADAVYSEDEEPAQGIFAGDQPDLARYARHFFEDTRSAEQLKALLQLTEAVAGPENFSGYQTGEYAVLSESAAELRQQHLGEIMSALDANGFNVSERSPNIFYHSELPRHRIRIGKTILRFESRERDGRWKLWGESLLLTREHERALELISKPKQIQNWPRLSREVGAGRSV
ncbi:MAG TPA: P-loop NTPase fold protein [Jiangellaceae bacterium]